MALSSSGTLHPAPAAAPLDAFRTTGTSPSRGAPVPPTVHPGIMGSRPGRPRTASPPRAGWPARWVHIASTAVAGRRGVVALPPRLPLEHGGILERGRIAYEAYGDPALPVVVVLGGISAGRHLARSDLDSTAGWWEAFVGPGRAVDTRRYRAVGVDFLGGPGASSGPADIQPTGGASVAIGTGDQARGLAKVLDYLGVRCVHAVVGSSYGAMVGLAFAAAYPDRSSALVCISGAHRPHPMATALRSLQRRIVRLGTATGTEEDALSLARGLAMTTYRTALEFESRFDTRPVETEASRRPFPVERYLENQGARFRDFFTAERFLALSESLDLHHVDPAEVTVATTLVAVESDTLVPLWQMEALAEALSPRATLVRLPSLFGHDAFLKEVDALTPIVGDALRAARTVS